MGKRRQAARLLAIALSALAPLAVGTGTAVSAEQSPGKAPATEQPATLPILSKLVSAEELKNLQEPAPQSAPATAPKPAFPVGAPRLPLKASAPASKPATPPPLTNPLTNTVEEIRDRIRSTQRTPRPGETPGRGALNPGGPATAGGRGGSPYPIDVNSAGLDDLLRIPGIDLGRAENILAFRASHGLFRSPEELADVEGISQKRLSMMMQGDGRVSYIAFRIPTPSPTPTPVPTYAPLVPILRKKT